MSTTNPINEIPEPFRAPAQAAIDHVIASSSSASSLQSVQLLSGGMSGALVYAVQIGERDGVLRIASERTERNNPVRALTSLQLAADVGVAPPVWYANADTGVSLSARVANASPNTPHDPAQLGALLRALQQAPAFPEYLTCFDAIESVRAMCAQQGIALPRQIQAAMEVYARVAPMLRSSMVLAPSHNDLNPGNLLFDGSRSWMIDWDGACQNDSYFDLACVLHWFRYNEAQEQVVLASYFGRAPSSIEIERLALMKCVAWCYYMLVFLVIALPDGGVADMDAIDVQTLPRFGDFLQGVGRGEHQLHLADTRRRLSLILSREAVIASQHSNVDAALARTA